MPAYKCDTCGNVRDFASAYRNIYCQEPGCDGMCWRQT